MHWVTVWIEPMTLPGDRSEGGMIIGSTLRPRPGEYQAGSEASMSVETVYGLANVSSAAATPTSNQQCGRIAVHVGEQALGTPNS